MLANAEFQVQPMEVPGTVAEQVTAIPLILPDTHEYDPCSFTVRKKYDDRKSLFVVKEALQMIRGIQEPLSVLAICGPQHSGKSYVLSRVLGMHDAFELGHSMDPKTVGIWVGTHIIRTKDKRGKDCCILLLDTESIDAVHANKQSDAGIFVLTILLCSQLIYNSLNVPCKKDLDQLECFAKLTDNIQVKAGADVALDDREHFPNLLWLLRDVSLIIPEESDGCPMDATQYINEKVLKRGTSIKRSRHDDTVEAIRSLFPKIEAYNLPHPSAHFTVMQNIAQHEEDLRDDFNDGVQQLVTKLIAVCQQQIKRGYDKGSYVTGEILASMIEEYVKTINHPEKIPQIESTWDNVKSRLLQEIQDALVTKYRQNMQVAIAAASTVDGIRLPMEENKAKTPGQECLLSIHEAVSDDVNNDLHTKFGRLGEAIMGEKDGLNQILHSFQGKLVQYQRKMIVGDEDHKTYSCQEVCGGEYWTFVQNNRKLSNAYCEEVYMMLIQPIKDRVENDAANYTLDQLMQDKEQQHANYMDRARGPAKLQVMDKLEKQHGSLLKINLRKLKEYQKSELEEKKRVKEQEDKVKQQAEELEKLREKTKTEQQQHKNDQKQTVEALKQHMSEVEVSSTVQTFKAKLAKMRDAAKARPANNITRLVELRAANTSYVAQRTQAFKKTRGEALDKRMKRRLEDAQKEHEQLRELIKAHQNRATGGYCASDW